MKNGTRQNGEENVARSIVMLEVMPRLVPRRKARSEIPESDFVPEG